MDHDIVYASAHPKPRYKVPASRMGRVLAFLALLLLPLSAYAQRPDIPMQHHSWGRFQPGAWQHIRVVTETLDNTGRVVTTTTTEKTTTLVEVANDNVKLEVETMVKVGGKEFQAPVQTISQGYHGEPTIGRVDVRDLGPARREVEGKKIPCKVREYVISNSNEESVVKIHYAPQVAPYILLREVVSTGRRRRRRKSRVEVTALNMPHRVFSKTIQTAHLTTTHQNGDAEILTRAVHSHQVPGALVSYSAKETNGNGQMIRRSTMELVDYGLNKTESQTGRGRRGRRRSK